MPKHAPTYLTRHHPKWQDKGKIVFPRIFKKLPSAHLLIWHPHLVFVFTFALSFIIQKLNFRDQVKLIMLNSETFPTTSRWTFLFPLSLALSLTKPPSFCMHVPFTYSHRDPGKFSRCLTFSTLSTLLDYFYYYSKTIFKTCILFTSSSATAVPPPLPQHSFIIIELDQLNINGWIIKFGIELEITFYPLKTRCSGHVD